jgi:hypothetical protein
MAYGRYLTPEEAKSGLYKGKIVVIPNSGIRFKTPADEPKPTTTTTTGPTGATGTSVTVPLTPEEVASNKAKAYGTTVVKDGLTQQQLDERDSYWKYKQDYGITNPSLQAKWGDPPNFDPSKTQLGLSQAAYGQTQMVNSQNLGMNLQELELQRRDNVLAWETLRKDIESGRLDATSNEATALANNLQAKTQALADTKRSMSQKGTLFGGVAQVAAQRAATPYDQRATDLKAQYDQLMGSYDRKNTAGKSAYDIAMDTYLGKKQKETVQRGVDQNPNTPGIQAGYGVGTWNPSTGSFDNITYGTQTAGAGQMAFGTDLYTAFINQQAKQSSLESAQSGAYGQNVYNQQYAYNNY